MKGTRPLEEKEIFALLDTFDGTHALRNKGLLLLGVSVGGRISELLSLTIGDVWQNNKPVTDLFFRKETVKGKIHGRNVPVNSDGQDAIRYLVAYHRERFGRLNANCPLFPSRNKEKGKVRAITRQNAHLIFKGACQKASLTGNLATHSLRKSYAQRLYVHIKDIFCIKEMLGHKKVETTQAYIGLDYEQAREASQAIALNNK